MTEDSSSSCSEPVHGNNDRSGKCPYAGLALSASSLDSSHSNTVSPDHQQQHGLADVSLASVYAQCPAFQNGSCPFKDKKDADSVRQTLLQIPSSHLEKDKHQFYHVLQQLHNSVDNTAANSGTNENNGCHLPGGCPIASNQMAISKLKIVFKNDKKGDNDDLETRKKPAGLSFTEAMESYSLASIMARMASIHEDDFDMTDNEQHDQENSVDNKEKKIVETKESDQPSVPIEKSKVTDETASNSESVSAKSVAAAVKLSECFKTGTIESHQAAEDVHFVKNFIRGEIDRDLYKDLILQLYFVYDALEGSLLINDGNDQNAAPKQQQNEPIDKFCLATFLPFHEKLQRKDTLIEDLDFWFGTNVAEKIVNGSTDIPVGQSDACKEYVQRIRYLAANEPVLLLAHSYTRYLGDLSGGKVLARVAKRALNLTSSSSSSKHGPVDGLAFYDFATTIPSAKKFKDEYKNALDSLPLSREQISRLVQEANVAFVLNMRLFEELDVKAGVPNATVRSYEEALQYGTKNYIIVEEDEKDNKIESDTVEKAKCPFAATGNTTSTVHYSKTNFSKISGDSKSTTTNGSIEQCPFAKVGGIANAGTASEHNNKKHVGGGRCPWPFVFAHDPIQGLRDWQTWALLGLILSYIWYTTLSSSSSAHITA